MPHVRIQTVRFEELLVCALLYGMALFEYDDKIYGRVMWIRREGVRWERETNRLLRRCAVWKWP
jgi:hypothetical protein